MLFFQPMQPDLFPLQGLPLIKLALPGLQTNGSSLWVKRLDLTHPQLSGNKYWKLKYNLLEAKRLGYKKLLTFGGAYSNHLYATAAAGQLFGFRTIGLVRGEEHLPLNSTLVFVKSCGMELHYLSRGDYRQKHTPEFQEKLRKQFPDAYMIPEGGSNTLAVGGCAEIAQLLPSDADFICLPCGTGGTLAGLLASGHPARKIGVAVLKGGGFLKDDVEALYRAYAKQPLTEPWELLTGYHFGGYAKSKPDLSAFIGSFTTAHGIPLEHVYSGKMCYAVMDLLQKGYFPPASKIVLLHTGGLRK